MINGRKVIVWTPYGRTQTYSILIEYLRRDVERGLVDEVWAFMNTEPTGQEQDIAYAHELADAYPWFKLKERPNGRPRNRVIQRNTGFAYEYMTDPQTVYVRMDDDIVWVEDQAIENLVCQRLSMPEPTAVFSTMWNNAIVSYFAQMQGLIPREWGQCTMYCMDPVGWADGAFAVKIHELLLDKIDSGCPQDLELYQSFPIPPGTQFSVSCFASLGSMYRDLPDGPGILDPNHVTIEEENWHTVARPLKTGISNILVGNALVSHYSFKPQKPHLASTNILDRYRALAEKIGA